MFKKIKEFKIPIFIFFTIIIIRSFVLNYYVIPSGSMYPNFKINDYIVVNRLAYGLNSPISDDNVINWSTPERGDLVVFHAATGDVTIKRVIGLPNEKIDVINEELFINGVKASHNVLNEEFPYDDSFPLYHKQQLTEETIGKLSYRILTIPQEDIEKNKNIYPKGIKWRNSTVTTKDNQYVLLGDNRNNSYDSRFFGVVEEGKIFGKVIY